jgi:hypothetical protein
MHRVERLGLLVAAAALMLTGCADPVPRPLADFKACTLGALESVRQGAPEVTVECPVTAGTSLVGLPMRRVTRDELTAEGLSRDAVDLLEGERGESVWCIVQTFDVEPEVPPVGGDGSVVTAESNCLSADLKIHAVVRPRGPRVRLVIERSDSGVPALARWTDATLLAPSFPASVPKR